MKLKPVVLLSAIALLSPFAQSVAAAGSAKGKSTADVEPPTVVIDAPSSTVGGEVIIRTTFTDNQGLFRYSSKVGGFTGIEDELFAGEKTFTLEYNLVPFFGQNTEIKAFATDLAGNTTTATSAISSETAITAGTYLLSEPLDEQISGSGCQLQYYSPLQLQANFIKVQGAFKGQIGDSCSSYPENDPDLPDPNYVACVSVSLGGPSYFPLGAGVYADIGSVSDTSFSETSFGSYGSGSNETYTSFTYMDVVFSNTTPPTISVDMTLRCESSEYGTEEFGPYHLEGTLQ